MNKLLPILFLALFLSTSNATWTAYQEVANMSKNYSTTQGNPWYYKYFISDQVRTDMTQSCSGTSGSNYQCWRSGYSAQTSISLFPTTYNMSMQVGAAAGNPFPNLAFIYYLTQDGNYTINGSAWGYSGIASGDGMNYTILVNDVVTCSGTLTISKSQTDFNCELGKELITGTKIEFDIGSNAGSSFDYGNFTATIYASLGSKDLPPVEILLPANNTQNTTLTQPIKYSPRLANDIMSASVWYNGSGWSELISNTSNVNNNEANWLYPVFPAPGLYTISVRVCDILNNCFFASNQTFNATDFIQNEIIVPTNLTSNITLAQPIGFMTNASYTPTNASLWINQSGWTRIANVSVTNNTLTWINTTIPIIGAHKIGILACDASTTCNYSKNYTIYLLPANLRIQVLNGSSVTPNNLHFNLTISNGTNTTIYATNNLYWFNRTSQEIPLGDLTILIGNSTGLFYAQNYYLNFNYTGVNLTAYLSLQSLLREVDVTVQDFAGNKLSGYYVNAQRSYFGSTNYTTIAQVKTDYSGQGVLYLDITDPNYRFVIYDTNYRQVAVYSPVSITSDDLIATDTYAKTFTINQQNYGVYGQYSTTTTTCNFASGTLTCVVYGAGASSNLTVQNLTAQGFKQICSSSTTPAEGTISCTISGWNGSMLFYRVTINNAEGTTFIATQGTLDYLYHSLNWGSAGFILFAFLVVTAAVVGYYNMNVMMVMVGITITMAKLLNVFNVEWEYVIGLLLIIGLIAWKSRG